MFTLIKLKNSKKFNFAIFLLRLRQIINIIVVIKQGDNMKQLSLLKEEPLNKQKGFFDETLEFIKNMKEESDYLEEIKEEFLHYLDLGFKEEELKNFYNHAYKAYNAFIVNYFEKKDPLYYCQLTNKYQEFVKIYHKIGNLLLFYFNHLYNFEKITMDSNTLERIETFIEQDKIKYQDVEATQVLNKIKKNKSHQFFIVKMDKAPTKKKKIEELKELDFILTNYFVLNYNKEESPVMLYTGKDELKKYAIEVALEYLSRLYSVSHYNKINDDYVIALENFIIDKKQKEIIMDNPKLCLVKSILLARINVRNVLGEDLETIKRVLQ